MARKRGSKHPDSLANDGTDILLILRRSTSARKTTIFVDLAHFWVGSIELHRKLIQTFERRQLRTTPSVSNTVSIGGVEMGSPDPTTVSIDPNGSFALSSEDFPGNESDVYMTLREAFICLRIRVGACVSAAASASAH